MADDNGIIQLKVDVGVLKNEIHLLSTLCGKMDIIIDKLVDQHDRHISKVYQDIDSRRIETEKDIKEIHDRIDTVIEKLHNSEINLLKEMKSLRKEISEHNDQEKESLNKLLQWKWMVAGGIVVLSWLISHMNYDTILNILK